MDIFLGFGEILIGWYMGWISLNIKCIVVEDGWFFYCVDDYSDDLFFWEVYGDNLLLIILYIFDVNDMWFVNMYGFI